MYPFRKELVGKRFLCVYDNIRSNSRPNSRSNRLSNPLDYQWKCGIIRACTEQESSHPEQKVLVEYDNEDWSTREWLHVYSDSWKLFLVEKTMVWAQRFDPNYPRRSLLWPALTFHPLVDKHGLDENQSIGVEFLGDHLRAFCKANEMRSYQEDDGLQPALRNNSNVVEELVNWQTLQKSQGILIHGPFTLTGFRVQVYREKCRQWFSAVITSHDLLTREMDVMDDTVLQTHRINPRLVMVLLLANEVELDSMLRGDLVRVLPVRRNRQAQVVITSSFTSTCTTPNSAPGNSMWQFLNDMWREPSSSQHVQTSSYQGQVIGSPSVSMASSIAPTATTSTNSDKKRGSSASRNNKIQVTSNSQPFLNKDSAIGQKPNQDSWLPSCTGDGLEQDGKSSKEFCSSVKQHDHESSTKNLALKHSSSPVAASFLHTSPLRSPIASPVHYQSPYSSLENLSHSNSSPQSGSKHNISPQRSFGSPQKLSPLLSSNTRIRASPVDNKRSPPNILDSQQPHFSSPVHPFNQTAPLKRQYTPPSSSSSFSPLRSTKLSPVLSSPAMHGPIGLQNSSGLSFSPPRINPMGGHSHDGHQMIGPCPCTPRQSSPQNILTNQLYALQLQQQRQLQNQQLQQLQHEQSLSQFYMQMNKLQLMADQLKSAQQGTLTNEQSETLNFYYNQIMSHYQHSLLKYHPTVASQDSMLASEKQMLKDQMQLKFFTDQQKRNDYEWQHPLPGNDQFQSFLSLMQQNANVEHLYTEFAHRKPKDSMQEDEESVKDHVARLKKFIPTKKEQSSLSSISLDKKPTKETAPISTTSSSTLTSSLQGQETLTIQPLILTEKEDGNKTDDQKVVDALVRKPGVSECPSTSLETRNSSSNSMLLTKSQEYEAIVPQTASNYKVEDHLVTNETQKSEVFPKKDDDPFGFDDIGDNVEKAPSAASMLPAVMTSSLDKPNDKSNILTTTAIEKNVSSKSKNNKNKKGRKTFDDDKLRAETSVSFLKTSTESETTSSRESVIKYVVNKSEPLVSSLDISSKSESKTFNSDASSDTELLPFSVDQLLEFHKTSAQEAIKIFESSNEIAKPKDGNEKKQGKKRKKEGKINPQDKEKEISKKKATKIVKQTKPHSKKNKHMELASKKKVIVGLENEPLKSEDNVRPSFDPLYKTVSNECKKQKRESQNSDTSSADVAFSASLLHKVDDADGLKDSTSEMLFHTENMTSTTSNKRDHPNSNLQSVESNKLLDWRSSRQNQNKLSSMNFSASASDFKNVVDSPAVPVNFVADQAVKSLTTVSKATEPVSVASLCGTEYVVEQIKMHEISDTVQMKAETTRQRKKSRKVLENELNTLEQDKLKEEEKEKVKKKTQKSKKPNKEGTLTDSVHQELKEPLIDIKKKKGKKAPKEEISKDVHLKGRGKLPQDSKSKKSKKSVKESLPFDMPVPQEVRETVTTDSEDKGVSLMEEEVKDDKNYDGKINLIGTTDKSNQEMARSDGLPINVADGKGTVTQIIKDLDDKEAKSSDSTKPEILESSDGLTKIHVKDVTAERKEKRKQEKKMKQSKTKEKQSNEQKDQKSTLEKVELKQDNSCREIDQREVEQAKKIIDNCSLIVGNTEVKKDENHHDQQLVAKISERNRNTDIPQEKIQEDTKLDDADKQDSKETTAHTDEVRTTNDIQKQLSDSRKHVENTKTVKKRKLDMSSEELSPNKKKPKVKESAEEYFIQNSTCLAFSKLPRCRDCRDKEEKLAENSQACCRFTLFRRLKKKKRSEKVQVAGFLAPENAEPDDFEPWIAHKEAVNTLSKDEALYIISNVADEFCSLVQEEKGAKAMMSEGSFVAYKRAVTGLREMCDACATTIFNIHWVCQKCGFGVCLDCYELRRKEKIMLKCGKKAFEFKWFNCMPGLTHQPKNLTIAQIIPNTVLDNLVEQLHHIRAQWNIGEKCPCNYEPDVKDKIQLTEPGVEPSSPATQSDNAQISSLDANNETKQEGKEENEGTVKPVVKKSIMERVRERLREKIEAQKGCCTGTLGEEEQRDTQRNQILDKGKEITENETAKINVPLEKTSEIREPDTQFISIGKIENTNDYNRTDIKQDTRQIGSESNGFNKPTTDLKNENVNDIKASQPKECKEDTTREANPSADDQDAINMSSGLSLLMTYDSSSDDSEPNTPSKPSSSTSSFDFNLGLLALVASSEQEKRTEVSNSEPQEQGCENKEQLEKDEGSFEVKKTLEKEKLMDWFKKVEEQTTVKEKEQDQKCEEKVSVGESTSMAVTMDTTRIHPLSDAPKITKDCSAPHSLLCNGRLLRLHEPHHPGNQEAFAKRWIEGKPVLVSDIDKLLDGNLWSPQSFEEEFGEELADVVNCRTGKTLENLSVGAFWKGFESIEDRIKDSNGEPMLLKLKDWPTVADFSEKLPSRFNDLMAHIPLPEYTRRDGSRNLASRLPNFFVKPDLGPKMYNAYGSAAFPTEGTTNLHIDMSDAVNIMVYVGVPREESAGEKERKDAIKAVDDACDEIQQQRVRRESARIGALWHIFDVDDADKIREFLHQVAKERKLKYAAHHDPIHDQCFYLDHELRTRLKSEHNVEGYAICQCLGDGVFIPAGAPHQVRNLYSCIKIAEDFVSPERIGQCFKTTQEFRHLTDKHTNHEDKLQIKNIIYHAVKDAVYILKHHKSEKQTILE